MHDDIARILLSSEQIAARVEEMGRAIAADLDRADPARGIVLVPVMTGAIIFVADLVRHLPQKLRIQVATVSSYPGTSVASQGAAIVGSLPADLAGRHVLIVDDILDSGQTLTLLREEITARGAASVRCAVLLRKQRPQAMATTCEHIGFDIPDEFVVGYGLDYDDHYRNLPFVGTLKEEAR
ncbi:MAG: hypoxanthine phosphoribosyltransferase [Phycisphaerales bacterium]|nr:hypoxanthine phosphoribosyltransferase [Phycisphaerales bacterium]